jgi:2-polyprenyl-3-methyl-5-hydroxy-6-metoxy-1,4-benzoquinol methylase
MSATANAIQTTEELAQLKTKLKTTWSTGDYDRFSRYMEKDAETFYHRLGIKPGVELLDVGCGAGQLALIAARAGARVTGCDIAPNWLEKARERAAAEGLSVKFEEGDAEALPYADGQFDVVASLVGAMFAPRPELVASEMTRVCKPGGMIVMANWTPEGFIGQMFKVIAKHIAPSGMPSPALWGDETTVRNRLRDGIVELRLAKRHYRFEYPFPPDAVVDFFRANYGPMTRAFASLEAEGQKKLRSELTELWASHNKSDATKTRVDAEYLQVVAIREGKGVNPGPGRRAALLADRIEEGAENLSVFVENLTEAEWNSVGSAAGTDTRTVGVIVHHVASVYPIEIQLAQTIANGNAVTDVTWEIVAVLNGKHAHGAAGATKAETLELLRKNSREAAAKVRALTDEELDRAAPFSLSYGAPVTAQFVIEDHALRHSWHHLAKIRQSLKK